MRIIGGIYRGRRLISPPSEITRPTSDRAKEGLFNILDSLLKKNGQHWEDLSFADIFAGSGAVGLEALSRGARIVYSLEKNPVAWDVIRKNDSQKLLHLLKEDALKPPFLKVPVDILFMDPPYGHDLWQKSLKALIDQNWIDRRTLIIVETDQAESEELPPFLVLENKRNYSRNKFLFLKMAPICRK